MVIPAKWNSIGKIVARWYLAIAITSSRIYEYNDDITKLCCGEQILLVPRPFVISRFHCEYY